jgi:hypothetical protein
MKDGIFLFLSYRNTVNDIGSKYNTNICLSRIFDIITGPFIKSDAYKIKYMANNIDTSQSVRHYYDIYMSRGL